ncbi:MAG: hypothetical protein A2Z96_00725, partial [Spirochaetes bacterium GWB1_48_6]
GEESTAAYEGARESVKRFIGAKSAREIIFTKGTTESINLVARSLAGGFSPGDEILLTEMEHHANIVPWQILAQEKGLVLKFLPFDGNGEIEWQYLEALWSPKIRLAAMTQMSNVLGTVNNVKRLISYAHERSVPVLIDAAQSVPHMKVNVQDLDADFVAFSGHKMLGPTGIGVLYAKESFLRKMPPFQGGGEMIRSVTLAGFEANDLPFKFEAGTPNIEGAVALASSIEYLETVGLDWIHTWEQSLGQRTIEGLDKIPGVRVFGRGKERGGLVAFDLEGVHAHDLSAFLDTKGIAVRAGHHCAHPLARKLGVISTCRASFYLYNTIEEVDFFLAAMEEARRVL